MLTKKFLEDLPSNRDNDKWSEWFYGQSKKDDLSDSFLQITGNLHNIKVFEEPEIQYENIIVIDG